MPKQVLVHINYDLNHEKISEHMKMETDIFLITIIENTTLQTRNICLHGQE